MSLLEGANLLILSVLTYTKAAILDKINATGFTNGNGKQVTEQTVDGILRNSVYAGYTRAKDPETNLPLEVKGLHAPLVEQQVFDRVQGILSGKPQPRRDTNNDFPFAVFVRCHKCGRSLRGYPAKGTIPWYDCKFCGASGVSVNAKTLRQDFVEYLVGLEPKAEFLNVLLEVVKDTWTQKQSELTSNRKEGEFQLQSLLKRQKAVQVRIINKDFGISPKFSVRT